MRRLKHCTIALCCVIFLVGIAGTARPQTLPDTASAEIAHLIDFIRSSSCVFIRNDTDYDGAAAADHVSDKYDYYKDDIHNAKDFIDLAATRSAMSGRPYQVRCRGEKTTPAADWLRTELQVYRSRAGNLN